jgi:hypothetical protein
VLRYLREGSTKTAQLLARRPVILMEPRTLLGTILWKGRLHESAAEGSDGPHQPRRSRQRR